eukprot:gene5883-5952_t
MRAPRSVAVEDIDMLIPFEPTPKSADLNKEPEEVASMFDGVAKRYDIMNDLLSLGQTKAWRKKATAIIAPQIGMKILDIAAGTGSSSRPLADAGAEVIPADFSQGMLDAGKKRHPDLNFTLADALNLPFKESEFDVTTISFGLRNTNDVTKALQEALRVTKPDVKLELSIRSDMKRVEELLRKQIQGDYPLVIETSRHLVEAGGKRLRPLLALLAAQFGDPKRKEIIEAAVVCELTHLATLYHDDVMDEAPLRRGVKSANARWNNTVAILTGDYLFAKASDLLADLGPEAVRLQARTFERLVIGQITETQGSTEGLSLLDHYLKVVADKTGSLIATSARFGALLSGAPTEVVEALTRFGEKIGVVFQLADDVIDIASESNESGKTPGTDLREGVPTLVTLYVLESKDPSDAALKEILSAPITDEAVVAQTLKALRSHPAMEASRA